MALATLVDSGAIIALFSAQDSAASHYRKLFAQAATEHWVLASTWPCIVEASYLLKPPAKYAMLRWIAAGSISVHAVEIETLEATVAMMKRWTEPPRTEMDLADATLMQLAEELGVTRIMTIDVRDFSRYRLADGRAFEIL